MMKDSSTAPAITVLHTSSHSCSVDQEEHLRTLLVASYFRFGSTRDTHIGVTETELRIIYKLRKA